MNPQVSIVIPTYNRANLIGETIQSVIDQTFKDWEMIVVDDGSKDATESVVLGFNDSRIRYIKVSHNGIFGFVRNQGIKIASADLIAFVDSDDLWRSDKLEVQISLLKKYPQAQFVFSNINIIGDSSVSTPEYEDLFVGNVLKDVLHEKRFIFYPSCLLFHRQVLTKTGLLNETLPSGSDMNFFFALCARFEGIFINQRLAKIRKHEEGTSDRQGVDAFLDGIHNIKGLFSEGFITKKERDNFISLNFYRIGLHYLRTKDVRKAQMAFQNLLKYRPTYWRGWIRLFQSLVGFSE